MTERLSPSIGERRRVRQARCVKRNPPPDTRSRPAKRPDSAGAGPLHGVRLTTGIEIGIIRTMVMRTTHRMPTSQPAEPILAGSPRRQPTLPANLRRAHALRRRSGRACPPTHTVPPSHSRSRMPEAADFDRLRPDSGPSAAPCERKGAVMEIRRALSHGANWAVALSHIPALIELIDEQQIPVDICLVQGTGRVALRAESVHCRRRARSLFLEGSGSSVQIDLDRLAEARAVGCAAGARRRISLQMIAEAGTALVTITGPMPGEGHAGQVWQLVMESLLPANLRAGALRASVAPRPLFAQSQPAPRPLCRPTPVGGWTLPNSRRLTAEDRLTAASRGEPGMCGTDPQRGPRQASAPWPDFHR